MMALTADTLTIFKFKYIIAMIPPVKYLNS